MSRPYFRSSIEELERLASSSDADTVRLLAIVDELKHRNSDRAGGLRQKLEERLRSMHVVDAPPKEHRITVAAAVDRAPPLGELTTEAPQAFPVRRAPAEPPQYPTIKNDASEILRAWTSLEVLSPATFQRHEDLAGGDRTAVVLLDRSPFPWERGAPSKPNYRLYYQIVLGSILMEPAIAALIERYGDSRAERPGVRGSAALAVIVIDQKGRVVDRPAVAVSSFGWGISIALTGALSDLASWPQAEPDLTQMLEAVFRRSSADGEEDADLPIVDRAMIERAYTQLAAALKLKPDWLERPSFAIKSYQYFRNPGSPDPLLLNSFFLGDLSLGRNLIERGERPANLLRYLGADRPPKPLDLLKDSAALDEAVAPKRTPLARWPAFGRHPLVLLQQAAVNLTFANLAANGVVGINGPPGTGKTTLLRDIVADVVRQRADAMTRFDDPEKAFSTTGQRIRAGNGWIHLYALDGTLRGHEIVVASSNNKAVQNVSAELPGIAAIAADAERLRYFPSLSRALHGKETWGLIAAVLGNAKNRSQFRQTFWWDEDYGLNAYLSTVNGAGPQIEDRDPDTNEITRRPPRIVQEENPPTDHAGALRRWKAVVRQYASQRAHVEKELGRLEGLRADVRETARLAVRLRELGSQLEALQPQIDNQRIQLSHRTDEEGQAQLALQRADRSRIAVGAERPGFFARLFGMRAARAWRAAFRNAETAVTTCRSDCARRREAVRAARSALSELDSVRARLVDAIAQSRSDMAIREERLARARASGQAAIIDDDFHSASHRTKQLSVAWLERDVQRLRDDLFIAAMAVHRAFVDAAARPLKHNIGALMNVFAGQAMPDAEKEKLRPSLWSSLFLVVPVVSTTFASVERMLGRLPPQSFGWLLVDEAGQALPQAAVGAIIRSQRVVMVGDPVQIEPVVALPDKLSFAICRTFGVDPDRFAAPGASAQTLADNASSHASELETRDGGRTVGIPLLVHRRCAEPMFGVSNSVAYAGMMVSSKMQAGSPIGDVLGPSRWIHVEGSGEDKWCEEEGRVVLDLLRTIVNAKCDLDLYIVTPFVIVADRLRQAILRSGVLDEIGDIEPRRWVFERVGTVHTVQGREAEAVVFVLGAPLVQQRGARAWAGGKPNLLNVAVTRAKEVLYVVGNRALWEQAGLFGSLSSALPHATLDDSYRGREKQSRNSPPTGW